jgi:hypothetical protein
LKKNTPVVLNSRGAEIDADESGLVLTNPTSYNAQSIEMNPPAGCPGGFR